MNNQNQKYKTIGNNFKPYAVKARGVIDFTNRFYNKKPSETFIKYQKAFFKYRGFIFIMPNDSVTGKLVAFFGKGATISADGQAATKPTFEINHTPPDKPITKVGNVIEHRDDNGNLTGLTLKIKSYSGTDAE